MIIHLKKKGKTGICPVCNKKRRKVIEIRRRTIRDKNVSVSFVRVNFIDLFRTAL